MKLISSLEAAEYLNISRTTLWRLTKVEKQIPAYHIGGSIKYNIEELDKYIESRRINPVKYANEKLNNNLKVKGEEVDIEG
jgi:excisionase family DNA binding protein